jgi:pimeloyl-ACP methyl ester carboxylesterase
MSTWILLRGLTREVRHWGDFALELARAVPEAGALALELPGSGELNAMESPITVAGMAEHCRADAAARGAAPPYHLVGMSLGGMVAAAWAERHPGEIAGCVLINTSFGHFSAPHRRLRPGAWPVLLEIALRRRAEARERLVLELTSGQPQAHPGVAESWAAIRRSRPVRPGNGLRQLLAAARYRAPAAAPAPTLVLVGARDRLVDPRCSTEIALRWRCALAVHPDAGHDLTVDDGPWVAERIREWLASLQGVQQG